MHNISDAERVIDAVCAPLGEYAPRKRRLIVDYKDSKGEDYHEELIGWHIQGTTDESLVEQVRADLKRRGYEVTAILELCEDGRGNVLYLTLGTLREVAAQNELTMPEDLSARLEAAGIHPVNWEELVDDE